jgi:dTDP-4-amino-4,6-dideoxygalactose transaminase
MNANIEALYRTAGKHERTILGLMSGTSLDGLDIAVCTFSGSGTHTKLNVAHYTTVPYTEDFKAAVRKIFSIRAVDLEAFRKLADEYGLWIIQDSCHSPGGYFIDSNGKKQNCGNGNFANLAIFSFHPVKHIAAGEGGMITTNDEILYKKLLNLRTHGIQQDPSKKLDNHGLWHYEMQDLGFNYRLTDFQAALGLSQLSRVEESLEKRIAIAKRYDESFLGEDFVKINTHLNEGHAYHLYIVEVPDRSGLFNYLRSVGLYAQVHYIPAHLMPYYKQFGWKEGDCPFAESYYKHCISLPIYPTLTEEDQQHVIESINDFFNNKLL